MRQSVERRGILANMFLLRSGALMGMPIQNWGILAVSFELKS